MIDYSKIIIEYTLDITKTLNLLCCIGGFECNPSTDHKFKNLEKHLGFNVKRMILEGM